MKTTRQRLTDFLQVKRVASVSEMSRALHVTAADVRHHLSILVEDGVVAVAGQQPAAGKGRPTLLYGLSGQLSEHNYSPLASAVLDELLSHFTAEEREAALSSLSHRLAGDKPAARNPGQSLLRAVNRLNEMHYQARWEAHADAPRVILGHCPYAEILPSHPELCQLDAHLLEVLLGVPVKQTARQEKTSQGLRQCVFVVGKKTGSV